VFDIFAHTLKQTATRKRAGNATPDHNQNKLLKSDTYLNSQRFLEIIVVE